MLCKLYLRMAVIDFVCSLCVSCTSLWSCTCMQDAKEQLWVLFSHGCSSWSLEAESLTGLDLIKEARLRGKPLEPSFLCDPRTGVQTALCLAFPMCLWEPNFGPHVYKTSTLMIWPITPDLALSILLEFLVIKYSDYKKIFPIVLVNFDFRLDPAYHYLRGKLSVRNCLDQIDIWGVVLSVNCCRTARQTVVTPLLGRWSCIRKSGRNQIEHIRTWCSSMLPDFTFWSYFPK